MKRRVAVVSGGLVSLLLLWYAVPAGLRRIPLFQVRRIEVEGSHYLAAGTIAKALRLRAQANIFDPVGPLERRVLAVPGITRVEVARRVPGTLVVSVEERRAVALAQAEGRLALVDRRGRVLPFDPTRAPTDLPVADADPRVLGLVERVQRDDPALFGRLVSAHWERETVVLETAFHRLLFRPGASTREIQGLGIVMAETERRGLKVIEFDARFEGRVIVRGARRT